MAKDGTTAFVPLQPFLEKGSAWDQEAPEEAPAPKTGNVWGSSTKQTKVVNLREQMEEEERKQREAKERKAREPPHRDNYGGGGQSNAGYGGGYGGYGGGSGGYEGARDAPRERKPLPEFPPYTAYVGNLPFESSTEEDLGDFFGELGIANIRVITDAITNKPKGFAYIEFKTREGLKCALAANSAEYHGRVITVDVASQRDGNRDDRRPRDRDGPGASGYGSGPRGYGSGGSGSSGSYSGGYSSTNDRYETGGGSWRSQNNTAVMSSAATGGPPRLGLQPRTRPYEEVGSVPQKRAGEDPFGGQSIDPDKLRKMTEERLKREQEAERRRMEQAQQRREPASGGWGRDNTGRRPGGAPGGRSDSSWGPRDRSERQERSERPERNRSYDTKPTRQELEKSEALVNPYAVLSSSIDDKE